jgi:hypothetical protein
MKIFADATGCCPCGGDWLAHPAANSAKNEVTTTGNTLLERPMTAS